MSQPINNKVCYCNTGYFCQVHKCYDSPKVNESQPYCPYPQEYLDQCKKDESKPKYLIKGDKGDFGEKGEKGEHGVMGPKGEPGFIGPKGDPGQLGFTGQQGQKGDKGNSIDIDEVITLDENKISYIINTYFNQIRTFYISQDNRVDKNTPVNIVGDMTHHIVLYNGTYFFDSGNLISLKGHKGMSGSKGEMGVEGIKGEKGEKGERGLKGLKGEDGAAVHKGDKGNQGNQGNKGEQGNEGTKGDMGDKGEPGTDGTKGEPGTDGTKGDIGQKGEPGTDGSAGTGSSVEFYGIIYDSNTLNYNDTTGSLDTNIIDGYHETDPDTQVTNGIFTITNAFKLESVYIDPTYGKLRYKLKNEVDNSYIFISSNELFKDNDFTTGGYKDYAPKKIPVENHLAERFDYYFSLPDFIYGYDELKSHLITNGVDSVSYRISDPSQPNSHVNIKLSTPYTYNFDTLEMNIPTSGSGTEYSYFNTIRLYVDNRILDNTYISGNTYYFKIFDKYLVTTFSNKTTSWHLFTYTTRPTYTSTDTFYLKNSAGLYLKEYDAINNWTSTSDPSLAYKFVINTIDSTTNVVSETDGDYKIITNIDKTFYLRLPLGGNLRLDSISLLPASVSDWNNEFGSSIIGADGFTLANDVEVVSYNLIIDSNAVTLTSLLAQMAVLPGPTINDYRLPVEIDKTFWTYKSFLLNLPISNEIPREAKSYQWYHESTSFTSGNGKLVFYNIEGPNIDNSGKFWKPTPSAYVGIEPIKYSRVGSYPFFYKETW